MSPLIKTPVLEYWALKEDPFGDFVLEGDGLRLFVGRQYELRSLQNALSSRCVGVYGTHGVGKSSFLRKFEKATEDNDIPVGYVRLAGTTEKALHREILGAILKLHAEKRIKTRRELKLNSKEELQRLESSIRIARESELGAAHIVKAGVKQTKEKVAEPHDEQSAQMLISEMIANTGTAFVVVVDDFERMAHFFQDETRYVRFVSGFLRTVDDSFSERGVVFVVSLDEGFVKRITSNRLGGEGEVVFSFAELIQLPNFHPQEIVDMIKARLEAAKWRRPLEEFMSPDAFWTLMVVTGGHPRKTLSVLRAAMQYGEMKQLPRKLDANCIKEGVKRRRWTIDEKDLAIVQFLSTEGARSPSDGDFQSAVNPKRASLSQRLKALTAQLGLRITERATGTATKDLYSLPEVRFSD